MNFFLDENFPKTAENRFGTKSLAGKAFLLRDHTYTVYPADK